MSGANILTGTGCFDTGMKEYSGSAWKEAIEFSPNGNLKPYELKLSASSENALYKGTTLQTKSLRVLAIIKI